MRQRIITLYGKEVLADIPESLAEVNTMLEAGEITPDDIIQGVRHRVFFKAIRQIRPATQVDYTKAESTILEGLLKP